MAQHLIDLQNSKFEREKNSQEDAHAKKDEEIKQLKEQIEASQRAKEAPAEPSNFAQYFYAVPTMEPFFYNEKGKNYDEKYTFWTSMYNSFCAPFFCLGQNDRFDKNGFEATSSPRSLRFLQINIFLLLFFYIVQLSWSANYVQVHAKPWQTINQYTLPTLLPPEFNVNNIAQEAYQTGETANLVLIGYRNLLQAFSDTTSNAWPAAVTESNKQLYYNKHIDAATALGSYITTTCYPLYEQVLQQNKAFWPISLSFVILFGLYVFVAMMSTCFKYFKSEKDTGNASSNKWIKATETGILLLTCIAEIVLIGNGAISISALAYNDYSLTYWSRQNLDFTSMSTSRGKLDILHLVYPNTNTDSNIDAAVYFFPKKEASSMKEQFRCFDLKDAYNKYTVSGFKTKLLEYYKIPNNIKYDGDLEGQGTQDKVLPLSQTPQARPKLQFDIAAMGIILFFAIIRMWCLCTEYMTTVTKDNAVGLRGGIGAPSAYPYNVMYNY